LEPLAGLDVVQGPQCSRPAQGRAGTNKIEIVTATTCEQMPNAAKALPLRSIP